MEYNFFLDFKNPPNNGCDERSRVIQSGIRYPEVNYDENEDRNDVTESEFEEYSDDVMKKMKTNHILQILLVDTS